MAADRRLLTRSGLAFGAGLAAVAGLATEIPPPASAQTPLDYLFGRPGPRYYQALPRRRSPLRRETNIPLPVPRPHFPGDPPAVAAAAPEAAQPEPTKPELRGAHPTEKAEAVKPVTAPATTKPPEEMAARPSETPPPGPAAPLPPTKPADLAKPETPKPDEASKAAPPSGEPTPQAPAHETPDDHATRDAAAGPHVDVPPPPGPAAPVPPPKPADLKPADLKPPDQTKPAIPTSPAVAPSGARLGEAPGQPLDDAACPGRLTARSVDAAPTSIGPQPDPRCTVVEPVRLVDMTLPDGSKVAFPDHPTIACTTAETFSTYVRDLLSPLAKGTFGAPLTAVWTGPGLECRSRDHIFGAKLSAHGQGLAIDIAQLKLGDGKLIEVGTPKTDQDQGFETAARAAACGYFHTVLGPGSDAYHRTHWHFDLEVRGAHGDSKYCK